MRTNIPHLAPVALALTITIATGCDGSPGGPAPPGTGVAAKKAPPRPGRAGKKAVPELVPEVSPTLFYD
jgi:hypothetical protein